MKKPTAPAVTGAELNVLEALWRKDASIRELRDELYPDGGESKFATVQKLLARLADKGLVARHKQQATWIYRACIDRDTMIGGELRRVADRLGGNSLAPVLTYLVEAGELTAQERDHLRRLLNEPPSTSRAPRKQRS